MTAPRKKAAPRPVKPTRTAAGDFEPLRLSSKAPAEERVVAFSIDDVDYTIPKFVSRSFAIKVQRRVREIGFENALFEGMEEFYGTAAMDALENCPSLTEDDWDGIQKIFVRAVYGEEAPGKERP